MFRNGDEMSSSNNEDILEADINTVPNGEETKDDAKEIKEPTALSCVRAY